MFTACFVVVTTVYSIFTPNKAGITQVLSVGSNRVLVGIPGISSFIQQGSLLRFALPNSRVTYLDLKGLHLAELQGQVLRLLGTLKSAFPDADIRESKPLRNTNVRMEFIPRQDMLVLLGLTQAKLNCHLVGAAARGLYASYRGSADRLKLFLIEFGQMFTLALFILALLMWISLKSAKLVLAVMLSMPVAILAGVINLQILNLFSTQNLDVVAMLGFIILIGWAINNTILLLTQFNQGSILGISQQN